MTVFDLRTLEDLNAQDGAMPASLRPTQLGVAERGETSVSTAAAIDGPARQFVRSSPSAPITSGAVTS